MALGRIPNGPIHDPWVSGLVGNNKNARLQVQDRLELSADLQEQGPVEEAGLGLLVKNFFQELKNPSVLAGMMAAQVASPLASRWVRTLVGKALSKGTSLALSQGAALLADGLAFEGAHRSLQLFQGLPVAPWNQSLSQTYWTLGHLRFSGGVGRVLMQGSAFRRALRAFRPNYQRALVQGFHDFFSYSGIYLSNTLGSELGLGQSSVANAWLHSALTVFHFKVAGSTLGVLAPRYLAWSGSLQQANAQAWYQISSKSWRSLKRSVAKQHFLHQSLAQGALATSIPGVSFPPAELPSRPTLNPPLSKTGAQWHHSFQKGVPASRESVGEAGQRLDQEFPFLKDPKLGRPVTHVEIRPPFVSQRYLAELLVYDPKIDQVKLQLNGNFNLHRNRRPQRSGAILRPKNSDFLSPGVVGEQMTTWIPPISEPELTWLGNYFSARVPWLNYQILRFTEGHLPKERRQRINPRSLTNSLPQIEPTMLQTLGEVRKVLLQPDLFSNWLVNFTCAVLKRMRDAGEVVRGPEVLTNHRSHELLKRYFERELIERGERLGFSGVFTISGQGPNISRLDFLRQVAAGKLVFDDYFNSTYAHGRPTHALGAIFLAEQVANYQNFYRYQGTYDQSLPQGAPGLWLLGYDSARERTYFRNPAHLYHTLLILMPNVHPVEMPYFSRS